MIHIRDEGGLVRQGLNIYPLRSGSAGFLLVIGRVRFTLRYSKITGWLYCYAWREETHNAAHDL